MSHYTINYAGLTDEAKQKQAIADIICYMGQERFDHISASIRLAIADGCTADDLRLPLSFAGIQGYPVEAWYNSLKTQV